MSKVLFVTGATSGIGASIVSAVVDCGDSVVATERSMVKLRTVFANVENDRLALLQLDVRQSPSRKGDQ